ncbi:DUF2721 domain-containing protein [Massilia sp. CFBP9012]|uniref:DUF2721 domain-containing protein n=1 Tax=Massilia sp. CFBP9012 TaxID=3096531 RepID=UPI002A6A45B3|nr:DUF2721 domain-containing protein [Massilia sp. CFBP9012]MDY0974618.1 DUF2721 domain-containing protein [Massilia sp. CFBP9012]
MTPDNPFLPLSFIAGPAILTNACAIMQNGAAIRYSLAITHLREFRASLAAGDDRFAQLYADTALAAQLVERRIALLLGGLNLLYATVGLFGLTTFAALLGAFIAASHPGWGAAAARVMEGAGGVGLCLLVAAIAAFMRESALGTALMRLHRRLD